LRANRVYPFQIQLRPCAFGHEFYCSSEQRLTTTLATSYVITYDVII
jgi:hypothetical protein